MKSTIFLDVYTLEYTKMWMSKDFSIQKCECPKTSVYKYMNVHVPECVIIPYMDQIKKRNNICRHYWDYRLNFFVCNHNNSMGDLLNILFHLVFMFKVSSEKGELLLEDSYRSESGHRDSYILKWPLVIMEDSYILNLATCNHWIDSYIFETDHLCSLSR